MSCKPQYATPVLPWGFSLNTLHDRDRLAGVQAELILGAVERKARSAQPSNSSYLEQRVQYLKEDAQLVDEESQGVMMAWEGPLMQAHAKVLVHTTHATPLAIHRITLHFCISMLSCIQVGESHGVRVVL